jgi:hypothetical protein
MKKSIMLLLMIFLSSCRTAIICQQVESSKIPFVKLYDVSFKYDRCGVRCFDLNTWATVPLEKCGENLSESLPLESCEGIAGFSLSDMAIEIRPKIKKLNQIKIDACGN